MEVRGVEERCTGDEGLDTMLLDTIKYTFKGALKEWAVKSYPSVSAPRGYTATVTLAIEDMPQKHIDNARRITEFTRMLKEQHGADVDIHLVFIDRYSKKVLAKCPAHQLAHVMQPQPSNPVPPPYVLPAPQQQIAWKPIEPNPLEDQIKSLVNAFSTATATGADLNAMGSALSGLERWPGESDADFRTRLSGWVNLRTNPTEQAVKTRIMTELNPHVEDVTFSREQHTLHVHVKCVRFPWADRYGDITPDMCREIVHDHVPLGLEYLFTVEYPDGATTDQPQRRAAKWKFEV